MNERIRLVYAGYDFFAPCLHWLIGSADVTVVACMTGTTGEPIESVRKIAEKSGIPVFFGAPTPTVVDGINRADAAILISAAYSFRLPVGDLDVKHAFNLHSSLLPEGRGPSPLPYVVDGRSPAGVTLHEMVYGFDAGPVVDRESITLGPADGFDELALKCSAAAVRLVAGLVATYPDISPTPQVGGSYWPLPDLRERTVDARTAATSEVITVKRRFGGSGVIVRVSDSLGYRSGHVVATTCEHPFEPGEVVSAAHDSVVVAVTDGLLRLGHVDRVET